MLVDEGGVSLRSLEMSGAQILHTSPNHQFPTGAVTPIAAGKACCAGRKRGRAAISSRTITTASSASRCAPSPRCRASTGAGRVIYVNTFSRTLAPSLRISYMVLPKGLTEPLPARSSASTPPPCRRWSSTRLRAFWTEGILEMLHINRMRKSYRAQRDAVIDTILHSPLGEHCRVSGEDAGLHFLLTIDTKCTDHVLRTDAEGRGVRLSFLSDFALSPDAAKPHTLVVNYPGIDLAHLDVALNILNSLL